MDDQLDLPPRRPLPPELRERLRATVRMRMEDKEFDRPHRGRTPFAAAAAVIVLAAGAAVVVQSIQDGGSDSATSRTTTPTSGDYVPVAAPIPPLDPTRAKEDLDRCWNVASASPAADKFSERGQWQALFALDHPGTRITAFQVRGSIAFCETTRSTASVSDPQASTPPGQNQPARLAYRSPTGTVAGLAISVVDTLVLRGLGDAGNGISHRIPASMYRSTGDTVFVLPRYPLMGSTNLRVYANRANGSTLEDTVRVDSIPGPAATAVDRPPAKPADRTSPAGLQLAECLRQNADALDPSLLEPAMVVPAKGRSMVAFTDPDRFVGICYQELPGGPLEYISPGFGQQVRGDERRPLRAMHRETPKTANDMTTMVGSADSRVASIEVTGPTGVKGTTQVQGGAFALQLPADGFTLDPQGSLYHSDLEKSAVIARDAQGAVLYQGTLSGI